jgi:hypothetical protein
MQPASLLDLAVSAALPLECVSAIVDATTSIVGKGFVVWLVFVSSNIGYGTYMTSLFRAFSSLEKAQKACDSDSDTDVKIVFVPYRLHHCGAKNIVYIYEYNGHLTVTNVVSDLENQLRALGCHSYRSTADNHACVIE